MHLTQLSKEASIGLALRALAGAGGRGIAAMRPGLAAAGRGALAVGDRSLAAAGAGTRMIGRTAARAPGWLAREGAETARFAAGVRPGERFAPTMGAGLWNATKAMTSPRYRGFDRAPGAAVGGRVLDRTRQNLATGARWASRGAMGLSGSVLADELFRGYPESVAKGIHNSADLNISGAERWEDMPPDDVWWRLKFMAPRLAPRVYWDIAKTKGTDAGRFAVRALSPSHVADAMKSWTPWSGRSRRDAMVRMTQRAYDDAESSPVSPLSRFSSDVVGDLLAPTARYNVHTFHENRPWLAYGIDAARSLNPAGALWTAGMHLGSTNKPPDVEGILRRRTRELRQRWADSPRSVAMDVNHPVVSIVRDDVRKHPTPYRNAAHAASMSQAYDTSVKATGTKSGGKYGVRLADSLFNAVEDPRSLNADHVKDDALSLAELAGRGQVARSDLPIEQKQQLVQMIGGARRDGILGALSAARSEAGDYADQRAQAAIGGSDFDLPTRLRMSAAARALTNSVKPGAAMGPADAIKALQTLGIGAGSVLRDRAADPEARRRAAQTASRAYTGWSAAAAPPE